MRQLLIFLTGLLFGFGLIISGMINPAKVIGFLDIFGQWDASLVFVMGGAVLVSSVGFKLLGSALQKPVFTEKFYMPNRKDVDSPLVTGAVLFGLGWALVGLCPGPGIAALTASPASTWVFFIAMFAGMYLVKNFGRFVPSVAASSAHPSVYRS